MPIVNGPKTVAWRIDGFVTGVADGPGWMQICGIADPVMGVGAACGGPAEFHSGKGTITYGSRTIWLMNVGFAMDIGMLTGDAGGAAKKASERFVLKKESGAGNSDCFSKADGPPKSGGARVFPLIATYAVF